MGMGPGTLGAFQAQQLLVAQGASGRRPWSGLRTLTPTMRARRGRARPKRRTLAVMLAGSAGAASPGGGGVLPMGHPLDDVAYVGNPAVPSVSFTLAEFHRQTFAHKVNEAVALVSALGALSMTVAAVQGWGLAAFGRHRKDRPG